MKQTFECLHKVELENGINSFSLQYVPRENNFILSDRNGFSLVLSQAEISTLRYTCNRLQLKPNDLKDGNYYVYTDTHTIYYNGDGVELYRLES